MTDARHGDGTADTDDPSFDSPRSEGTTQAAQEGGVQDSPAMDDGEVNGDAVNALPGTGGPDDEGDVEVDPSELNMSGDSIPGHPKPDAGA
ncbi:hypothetical protein [Frigoribacterium salinisoli]